MFLRWEIIRGWMPGIVFAAIAVAIEILYFEYMLSRGLADETFSVSLGIVSLPLSISLFLSLGNAIVLLVLWMSVFESTAYVMAGPDRRVRRLLYPLRMKGRPRLSLLPSHSFCSHPTLLSPVGSSASSPGFRTRTRLSSRQLPASIRGLSVWL